MWHADDCINLAHRPSCLADTAGPACCCCCLQPGPSHAASPRLYEAPTLFDVDDLAQLLQAVEQQVALLDGRLVQSVLGVRPARTAGRAAGRGKGCSAGGEGCRWLH